MKVSPMTVPSRDIGTCDCGSTDLEVELDIQTIPLEPTPSPAVLTGVMNVGLSAKATRVRCRSCGREHEVDGGC